MYFVESALSVTQLPRPSHSELTVEESPKRVRPQWKKYTSWQVREIWNIIEHMIL